MGATRITPEIADIVLERITNGEILTAVAREFGFTHSAFSHKADKDQAFAHRYAQARERQAHAMAMDVVRIADEEKDPAVARNRMDARKWLAARIDPKNYGERRTIDHHHTLEAEEIDYPQLVEIAQGRLEPPTIEHEATDVSEDAAPPAPKKRRKR